MGRERPAGDAGDAGEPGADASPIDFLVMEHVEGETLTARLARRSSRATRNVVLSRGDPPSDPTAATSPSAPGASVPAW
ncbi:MAG: hypothetical protein CK533_09940 [Acidobacterium sp.]|nr:MAG: hypothetical protein CK533_09940 [Acidobacterium sp.]